MRDSFEQIELAKTLDTKIRHDLLSWRLGILANWQDN